MADLGNLLGAIIDIRTSKRTKEAEKAVAELDKKIEALNSKKIDLKFSEKYQQHLSELKKAKKALANIHKEDYPSTEKYKEAKKEARKDVAKKQLSVERSKKWHEKYNKSVQSDVDAIVSHRKAVKDDEKENKRRTREFKDTIGKFNLAFQVATDTVKSFVAGMDSFIGTTSKNLGSAGKAGLSPEKLEKMTNVLAKTGGYKFWEKGRVKEETTQIMDMLNNPHKFPQIAKAMAITTGGRFTPDSNKTAEENYLGYINTLSKMSQKERDYYARLDDTGLIPESAYISAETLGVSGKDISEEYKKAPSGAKRKEMVRSLEGTGKITGGISRFTSRAGGQITKEMSQHPFRAWTMDLPQTMSRTLLRGLGTPEKYLNYNPASTQTMQGNNVGTIQINNYNAKSFDMMPPSADNHNILNNAVNLGGG